MATSNLTEVDYLQQLQALLPQGIAWSREPDANLTKLLSALASEYLRLDDRVGELIEDALPTQTVEMLPDWECVAGLITDENASIEYRQQQLVNKLNFRGGQSRAFFIALAESFGLRITITEFRPFRVGLRCIGESLTNGEWVFCWVVHVHDYSEDQASACAKFVDTVERSKPAHTLVIYSGLPTGE